MGRKEYWYQRGADGEGHLRSELSNNLILTNVERRVLAYLYIPPLQTSFHLCINPVLLYVKVPHRGPAHMRSK